MKTSLLRFCGIFTLLLPGVLLTAQIDVHQTQFPVMIDRSRNIITEICIDNSEGNLTTLAGIEAEIKASFPLTCLNDAEVYYTGATSMLKDRTRSQALKDEFKRIGGSQQVYASSRYAILKSRAKVNNDGMVRLSPQHALAKGKNYFYISLSLNKVNKLTDTFTLQLRKITIDGKEQSFTQNDGVVKRLGVSVKNHGDDGVYAYRIPGLVTTKKGSLLGVYDVRYNTSLDLQDDIDVGVSRSTDGGLTWEKMRIVMDKGEFNGQPESENGIGDPCIVVDEVSGDIFVIAVWTHTMGGDRAWTSSKPGMSPTETAQLLMTKSSDDGRTWSPLTNITPQVKDSSWRFLLQGPGRGITMRNGTIVVPIQYIDSLKMPHSAIMYSRDRGNTWATHTAPKPNTTEAQVVEINDGELMLNMRDNTKKGRAVYTTKDMGKTWTCHSSSNGALQEPVCMASLHMVKKADNKLSKNILLFSNPNEKVPSKRWRMTIKASLDKGNTWDEKNQLLIDEEWGWGYSCLTMIDADTVGILYEGSTGQLVFQAIPLNAIVK